MSDVNDIVSDAGQEYITVVIAGQLFGLPILEVQDVFMPEKITTVPMSAPEIEGVLNLRGRIVTAINMRKRLSLPLQEDQTEVIAVGIEYNQESYGLIIDDVGEVLKLDKNNFDANPNNLDPKWSQVSAGVYQLEKELLVVLDVTKILDFLKMAAA